MLADRIQKRLILQDWTRVEDLQVADAEFRSYEFHVVEDVETDRVTLTIKCFNPDAQTIRLDPSDIRQSEDPEAYSMMAEKRVRKLFENGMI